MSPRHAHEVFARAVHDLATRPDRIQERLGWAWRHLAVLRPEEMPEGLRSELDGISERWAQASLRPLQGEAMSAALALSDDEAMEAARQILFLEYQLRDWTDE